MDKPRHPQVIRPWKIRQLQTRKGASPGPTRRMRRAMPRNPQYT